MRANWYCVWNKLSRRSFSSSKAAGEKPSHGWESQDSLHITGRLEGKGSPWCKVPSKLPSQQLLSQELVGHTSPELGTAPPPAQSAVTHARQPWESSKQPWSLLQIFRNNVLFRRQLSKCLSSLTQSSLLLYYCMVLAISWGQITQTLFWETLLFIRHHS